MTVVPTLTPAGLTIPSATDTKADLDQAFAGIFGGSILVDGVVPAQTSIGQEIAIITDDISARDQFLQYLYGQGDISQSVTPILQYLCALTGTNQKPATFSTALVTCVGTAGTVLISGRVVTVQGTGSRFLSTQDATLATATAWTASTGYAVGQFVTNSAKVYQCITAGTSAGGGGPTTTSTNITDGSVHWTYLGVSTVGVAYVPYQADTTGPINANASTLINIATPVSGWVSCTNIQAATLGANIESEPALRARQVLELQNQGGGPANSIRANILSIPTVTACVVFVNDGDAINADGVPAHGVEVLIEAPLTDPTTNAELALDVFNAVGAGIATGGAIPITITDDSGNPQDVRFSRPTAVPIYVVATVYFDVTKWPAGAAGIAAVEAAAQSAIMTYGATLAIGVDVRSSQLAGAIEDGPYSTDTSGMPIVAPPGSASAPGIVGVANGVPTDGTLPFIGIMAAPMSSTTITITSRQLATFIPANISITAVAAVP